MKAWVIIAAAVFQVVVLAYMGTEREYVVRTGKTVYLRTAPIDPRDLFRGDFISLNYDISDVAHHLLRDGLSDIIGNSRGKKGSRVYAVLSVNESNLGEVLYLTNNKPKDGLFIRGRFEHERGGSVHIRYGIEAYFVEQGKGEELEQVRGRQGIQVPLEMEVALGRNGLAVLKNHRYGPLGIGIELKRDPNDRPRGRTQGVRLQLLNASDKPLAIIDLPEGRSFSLEPDLTGFGTNAWRRVNENAPRKAVENSDVHVLKLGEIYEIHIDFSNPVWFVTKDKEKPRTLSGLDWGNRFRLVYRPPSGEECRHLDKAALVWHGYLPSRAFSGGGWTD